MADTRVGEAKPDGKTRVRKVTRHRKNYGRIVTYPDKKVTIYWSARRTDQYHNKERSWLIEADTMSAVRLYGVTHVGLEIEDGRKLLTAVATFGPEGMERGVQRKKSADYVDPWGRRGAMCWFTPDALWAVSMPDEETRTAAMLAQMHLKRSRMPKPVPGVIPSLSLR